MLFLDHSGWICSVEMSPEVPIQYRRHFFLPWDWLSANHHLLFEVTVSGDVIFAKDDELAVIRKRTRMHGINAIRAFGTMRLLI